MQHPERSKCIIPAIFCVLFLLPGMAGAFSPINGPMEIGMYGPPDHFMPFGLWRDPETVATLKLSDDQLAKLKAADFALRETKLETSTQLERLFLQMDKAFSVCPADDRTALETARKIAESSGKIFIQDIEAQIEFEKILTPDQLKALETFELKHYRGNDED